MENINFERKQKEKKKMAMGLILKKYIKIIWKKNNSVNLRHMDFFQ